MIPDTRETPAAPGSGTPAVPPLPLWRRLGWIAVFAFASGLPFGVFKDLLPVWLRSEGVSLETIGVFAALASPWSMKVLWAPLVDRFGGRRPWIFAGQLALAASIAALALIDPHQARWIAAAVAVFVFSSATADIAIDAWTIGVLHRDEEGPANSTRVTAYRVAILVAGGGAMALAGLAGWPAVFLGLAGLFGVLALAALAAPRLELGRGRERGSLWRGLAAWLRRPGGLVAAAFILVYKWPDAALGPMVRTYWVDAGLSLEQIGSLVVPATIVTTIVGAVLGGWFVARAGVLRGLLWLGLAQTLSNLAYAAAAALGAGTAGVVAAASVENFCAGLGTAAFLSLLMRLCEKERAATEYALVSALFALTRDLTGAVSGFGVGAMGYAGWFAASVVTALPGMALLFVPLLARRVGERPLARIGGRRVPS